MIPAVVFALASWTVSSPAFAQDAMVRGVTVDAQTAVPIAGAQVLLVELARSVRTDAGGRFVFDAVPPGTYTLNVSLIGYVFTRREIQVLPNAAVEMTIAMTEGTGTYQETVRVTASASEPAVAGVGSQAELGSAALQELRSVAADDPMRAVQALPGVATGDDFQAQFSVRGSEFRHVGIVLDDTATQLMLHTVRSTNDTASIAMINTDVLDGASLLAGAHPQRHGDWLGATLDFSLRDGSRDRTAYRVAASATTASLVAEGPLGRGKRASWLASVRRSYIDWLVRKLYPSIDGTLGFTDMQSKLAYDVSSRQQVQFILIAGDAGFRNDNAGLANGIRKARSRTALASASWRYTRESLLASQRVSFVGSRFSDLGRIDQTLGHGYGRSVVWRGDVNWMLTSAWSLEGGAKNEWQHQTLSQNNFVVVGGVPQLRLSASSVSHTDVASVWGQLARRTRTGGGSFGARLTRDSLSDRVVTSPWLAGEHVVGPLTLQASAGVTHQFPELELQRGLPERLPERAAMADVSVVGGLPARMRWQVTGFWRREQDVIRRSGEDRLIAPNQRQLESIFPQFSSSLDGRTRGIDLLVGRRASTGLTGWVAYTYSHTRDHDRITQENFDGDFDQRHTFNAFVQERVSYRTAVSAKLRIGSNFPLSGYFEGPLDALRLGAERNVVRLPTYARLDVRANRTFTFDRRRLTLFLELVNVTDRSNLGPRPGFISGKAFDAVNYTQKLLPFLPSAGVLVEF